MTSSLQRYAALTRLELEEKAYAERSRGQSSCWTKILKSSPAVAEPSELRFPTCEIRKGPYVGFDCLLEGIGWNRIDIHAQDWLAAVQTLVFLFHSEQPIQQRLTLESEGHPDP